MDIREVFTYEELKEHLKKCKGKVLVSFDCNNGSIFARIVIAEKVLTEQAREQ